MELNSPALIIILILITVPVIIAIGFWVRFIVHKSKTERSSKTGGIVMIAAEKTTDVETKFSQPPTPGSLDTRSVSTVSSGSTLKEAVLENFRNKRSGGKARSSKVTTLQIQTSDIDAFQV